MSRARELAKVGGKNQQVIAGLSSHVGVSTFLNNVHMFANLDVGGNVTVTGTTTFNGGTLTLGDANTDNIVFGGEVDSHIVPDDDNTYDLGSSTKEWRNLYIDGTAKIDMLTVDGDATVAGNFTLEGGLDARGNVDLGNATSDTITATGRFDSDLLPSSDGARDLGSSTLEWQDLYIDGTANIDSLVADTADINGGTVDGAAIGGNSASTGAFTTISASGNVDFNGNLDVDGTSNLDAVDIDGAVDMASTLTLAGNADFNGNLDVDGTTNLDAVDIDGAVDMASSLTLAGNADFNGNLDVDGTTNLDGTNIAGTLAVSGAATVDNLSLNGNTVTTSSGNLTLDSSGGTVAIADNATVSGGLTVTGTTTLSTKLASSNLANSGVSAGTYGSSTAIPILVVNAQGQVTSASTTAVDSTTIEQLNTSVACTDTGTNGLVTVTADGSTVAVFDQALLTVTGNILPDANGTRDLGANGTRWANVYTSDIDLNNQAKGGNTIDGSWGSYLIEEGADDLFLKNRRTGKTYKFMLQEV